MVLDCSGMHVELDAVDATVASDVDKMWAREGKGNGDCRSCIGTEQCVAVARLDLENEE